MERRGHCLAGGAVLLPKSGGTGAGRVAGQTVPPVQPGCSGGGGARPMRHIYERSFRGVKEGEGGKDPSEQERLLVEVEAALLGHTLHVLHQGLRATDRGQGRGQWDPVPLSYPAPQETVTSHVGRKTLVGGDPDNFVS
eukprot:EG_transcript_18451